MSRAFWREVWQLLTRPRWAYGATLHLRTCTVCGQAIMPKYIHLDPADHEPTVGPVRR